MLGFLPDFLRAFIYIVLALAAGRLFLRAIRLQDDDLNRWFTAWLVFTTGAFFLQHFLVLAVLLVLAGVVLRKASPTHVAATFVALLPVMPLYPYVVPGFAGINQIMPLDYYRMLTLALLLPALFALRATGGARRPIVSNGVDLAFYGYCAWMLVASFLHRPSLTDSLRGGVETVLFMLVPYYALSRLVSTHEQFRKVVLALVFSGFLVSFIGLMEQRMSYFFYQFIPDLLQTDPLAAFARAADVRFGFLRMRGSIDSGIGYFVVIALGGYICLLRDKVFTGWRALAGLVMMLIPVALTGSRGAWFASGILLASNVAFVLIRSPGRFLTAALLAFFLGPVIQSYVLSTPDEFGTFSYRRKLLDAGIPLVFERPLAGWGAEVYTSGRLEHLRQGQGIIDIVNSYLGEALFRGLPALVLFVLILVCSAWAVLRRHARLREVESGSTSAAAAMLVSLVVASAFALATTSTVGHIPAYLWLLAALSSAYSALPARNAAVAGSEPAQDRPVVPRVGAARPMAGTILPGNR